jgi:hypothetical protein
MTTVIAAVGLERIDQMVRWIGEPTFNTLCDALTHHPTTREHANSPITIQTLGTKKLYHRGFLPLQEDSARGQRAKEPPRSRHQPPPNHAFYLEILPWNVM